MLGASRAMIIAALAVASALALLIELLRRSNTSVRAAFDRIFGPLLRPREKTGITGATWLALSCLAAVVVFSRSPAIAAMWCATVGDPAATIVGRWTDRPSSAGQERGDKTVAGSIGCFAASFAGVWILAGYPPPIALAIAAMAAVAEAWPVRIDDNLRIAAATGAIAQLLA